ncbi:hypothetical protein DFH11DRAFT_788351 [Phellopilus nigrolimitatus]|nr:hypothetical protein DFH11DRAFT_788351 [Phellopilus nigrolimitatus]
MIIMQAQSTPHQMPPYHVSKRSDAAKTRNYDNCTKCKEHHQKCKVAFKGASCERCKECGYPCSLKSRGGTAVSNIANSYSSAANNAHYAMNDLQRADTQCSEDTLYEHCDGGKRIVFCVRIADDGLKHVYLTECDANLNPTAPPVDLGS